MFTRTQVAESKSIQQATGPTFHVATRALPREYRHPTYVLYAFFRIADDIVDTTTPAPPEEQFAELEHIRAVALGTATTDDPVLEAFVDVKETYGIDDADVNTFIDAMQRDIAADRFDSFGELETYLRGSSVAVANMLLDVFKPPQIEGARPHAKALAEAFQLTNFLRDVREDVQEYGRIYLTDETLDRFGVDPAAIESLQFDDDVRAAIKYELERTEALYSVGVRGIQYLPESVQLGVLLSATLYAAHHRKIRAQNFDVLSSRPTLSTTERLTVAARTWFHWRRTGDPVETFEAVSGIGVTPTTRRTSRSIVSAARTLLTLGGRQ